VSTKEKILAVLDGEMYGYQIARAIEDRFGGRLPVGHGILYGALSNLEDAGYLTSRWEDDAIAVAERRPRRRYYQRAAVHPTASAGPEDGA